MRNKYNEPRSGCAMSIGCGSLIILAFIIYFILTASILNGYMSEIYAKSQAGTEEYTAYIASISQTVYENISRLLENNGLQIMINAAQIVVIFIVFKLIYKRPLAQMGLSRKDWLKNIGMGCLTGALAISLFPPIASVTGAGKFSGFNLLSVSSSDLLTAFILFICAGFYEEILFRGFFMTALKTTRKKRVIIMLPAVIFGLLHLGNPGVTVIGAVNIILIGLAFAYMLLKTGSIWMSVGYHIMWNFFQGNIYGIHVSGTVQASSIIKYTPAGPDILTGGAFGAEGGLICTVITLAALAYIHYGLKPAEQPVWTIDSDLPFSK